jgi:hypothetical protein
VLPEVCETLTRCFAEVLLAAGCRAEAAAQLDGPCEQQLPDELGGARAYRLPEECKPGQPAENPAIYSEISIHDGTLERLALVKGGVARR